MDRDAKADQPSAKEKDDEQRRLERALEEGLRESFPGSDAVNVVQPRGR
jgi:hypothetical protein